MSEADPELPPPPEDDPELPVLPPEGDPTAPALDFDEDSWEPPLPPEDNSPPPPPPDDDEDDLPPPMLDIPPPPFADIPPPSALVPPPSPSPAMKRRKAIATEIVDTEATYYSQLNTIVSLFLVPLKQPDFELSSDDLYILFSNVEVIARCHSKFLENLRSRLSGWSDESCLGDIFVNDTGWIKLYRYYVNNYDNATKLLAKLRVGNQKLKSYLKVLEYKPAMQGLNLESFLVVPVQRIPRYVLLLQDMVKSTPESHPDKALLEKALSNVKEVADYINEHKHVSDRMSQLEEQKARINGLPFDLVLLEREFIRDGPFIVNKEKARIFLFNDVAIITSADTKKGKHKYREMIGLKTAAMQREEPLSFKIASTEGIFHLQCSGAPEYDDWGRILDTTLEHARESLIRSAFEDVASVSDGSAQYVELKEQQAEKKRRELVSNLLTSEKEYVRYLNHVAEIFIEPLKDACEPPTSILSPSQMQTMLSNFEQLVTAHSEFLQDLQMRDKEWDQRHTVADLFEDRASFLRAYGHYVSHHTEQITAIEQAINNNPKFLAWVRQHGLGGSTELKKLLEMPLRRVPEYYLLMQEMEQTTSKKHPDYDALKRVVTRLTILTDDLAKKSNEAKHQSLTGAGSLSRKHTFTRTLTTPAFKKF